MLNFIGRFITEEKAQGMTEYALVLGVITVTTIALITIFSGQVQTAWTYKTNGLGTAITTATGTAP